MRSIAFVALAASALLFSPVAASCGSSTPTATTGATPAGQFYVVNDVCQPGCIVGIYVYQETNGLAGLQRADDQVDNTCGGLLTADTRLS